MVVSWVDIWVFFWAMLEPAFFFANDDFWAKDEKLVDFGCTDPTAETLGPKPKADLIIYLMK